MFDIKTEVLSADQRIRPYIRETQLEYSISLSKPSGCKIYLKCENLQYAGAFKARGALSKLLSLTPEERKQGVVTASSGNHGAAVAFGCNKLNINGIVFVPKYASSTKLENIRNYEVPVELYSDDWLETELYAIDYAKKNNKVFVSPYNDLKVIGGQGTIAIELMRQLDKIDAIFVAVGGGGLISGIGGFLKSLAPHIKIIGCLPENSPVMAESVKEGQIIEMETKPTLSDATAGCIEPGSITFDICREVVDDFILVSEDEIKNAIIQLIKTQHLLVEGASGVALAALLKSTNRFQGKNCVVILSGGNISFEVLKSILHESGK